MALQPQAFFKSINALNETLLNLKQSIFSFDIYGPNCGISYGLQERMIATETVLNGWSNGN
jgi:hypothetical protein